MDEPQCRCAPSRAVAIAAVQSRHLLHSTSRRKAELRLSASRAFDLPRIAAGKFSRRGSRAQRTPSAEARLYDAPWILWRSTRPPMTYTSDGRSAVRSSGASGLR